MSVLKCYKDDQIRFWVFDWLEELVHFLL